jgi:hypothetical protein
VINQTSNRFEGLGYIVKYLIRRSKSTTVAYSVLGLLLQGALNRINVMLENKGGVL